MTTRSLLVGVDGGQTSTKAMVAAPSGRLLGAGEGRAFDHFRVKGGAERNRAAIHESVSRALRAAGARPEDVAAIALGLTGVRTGGPETSLVESIARDVVPAAEIVVVADYESNLAGANGGQPGVVVIAGGGSIGFGVTADGRQALASGYGYLLGDEGSAFSIGRAAIIAAARASDDRDEATSLVEIIRSVFDIETVRDVRLVIYHEHFSRDTVSRLAPHVVGAAEAGDHVAQRIVRWAGEELALTALSVIRQLYPDQPEEPVPVAITGGVFRAGPLLLQPFRATLEAGWPGATAHEPRFPPAVGTLIFAARAADIEPDAAWLDEVAVSLPS